MPFPGWKTIPLTLPPSSPGLPGGGSCTVAALAPLVVSASRETDIPAFFGEWLMARLDAGYVRWDNPYSGTSRYVSLRDARLLVLWSKNPAPFLPHLPRLLAQGRGVIFQYTLNDYEQERLEPNLPPLGERIPSFLEVSRILGPDRIVWRFDPVLFPAPLTPDGLLSRLESIGRRIRGKTTRLVISFVDINRYRKVSRNLQALGFSGIGECTPQEVDTFASGLSDLATDLGLSVSACSEDVDLSRYGIHREGCISCAQVARNFGTDPALRSFLGESSQQTITGTGIPPVTPPRLHDPGQRSSCHCMAAKDIGCYSTCPHLCAYCYANSGPARVRENYARYQALADAGIFGETIIG